jgi:hypothetical protein
MQRLAALLLWEQGGEAVFSPQVLEAFDFRNAQILMSKTLDGSVKVELRGIPFPPPSQPVQAYAERVDRPQIESRRETNGSA